MDVQPLSAPLADAPFLACMIADAIATTTPLRETEEDAQTRAAIVADMLRAFAPANAMEGMIACHCVMLRYALLDAMRALSAAEDEKTRARLRSAMNGLSRTAHQWIATYQKTQVRRLAARKAADAAETGEATSPRPAVARPVPGPAPTATRSQPEPPPPEAPVSDPPMPEAAMLAALAGWPVPSAAGQSGDASPSHDAHPSHDAPVYPLPSQAFPRMVETILARLMAGQEDRAGDAAVQAAT